jgi:hypothetical protein
VLIAPPRLQGLQSRVKSNSIVKVKKMWKLGD